MPHRARQAEACRHQRWRLRVTREAVLLSFVVCGAVWLRGYLPYDRIFRATYINFQGDAWYHMRVVDHLVRNFPHRLTFDPYAVGGGSYVAMASLLDYVVATLALVAGLGNPSDRLIEIVGAFTPVLLAALTVVLVYFFGRRLFDSRAGLLAAALAAVIPGHFLDRTMLGVTDHHGLEVVLAIATLLLLATATTSRRAGATGYDILAGAAAGTALGAYLLAWTSGAFLVFVLTVWVVLQTWLELLHSRSPLYLARVTIATAAAALVLVLVFQNPRMFRYGMQVASLAALMGAAVAAAMLARIPIVAARPALGFPVAVAGVVGISVATARTFFPAVTGAMLEDASRLLPGGASRLVAETQPLFYLFNQFSLGHAWSIFRSGFFLGAIAVGALAIRMIRSAKPAEALLFVWSVVVFAATIGQNRFGYYLVPTLALLTGWLCSFALELVGTRRRINADLVVVAVAAIAFYPNLKPAIAASVRDEGPPPEWHQALTWVRQHTPDPFGDPAFYYARYDTLVSPRSPLYTVMAWWDYGYWVARVGRRVPVANPTQTGALEAALFFTASDPSEARRILDATTSRYVVADRDLVFQFTGAANVLRGKFESLVRWAGRPPQNFFEGFLHRLPDGRVAPVWVFYPDYYRTMAAHLSLYGGQAVEARNSTWVITFGESTIPGAPRVLLGSRAFATYEAAQAHLRELGPGPHRLVGLDPLRSPAPLPALPTYRLLPGSTPTIKVFEHVPGPE